MRIAALAFLLVSAACTKADAQGNGGGIPAVARRTIAEANAAWMRAMKQGDAAVTAEPYADDAVFVTASGESVRGRAAIETLMRDRFASGGHAVSGTIIEDGLTAVGARIYEWGHVAMQLVRGDGQPTESKGRYLTVWAADSSGRWRIIRNLSLAF